LLRGRRLDEPNKRNEFPTPIQYPRAIDRIAMAMMENLNAGSEGREIAAFSTTGFLDMLEMK
jgi:hypothetical protein